MIALTASGIIDALCRYGDPLLAIHYERWLDSGAREAWFREGERRLDEASPPDSSPTAADVSLAHRGRRADPYLGPGAAPLTLAEQELLPTRARWHEDEGGYVHLQRTRPQTLAYGLADSPVGLAAWLLEKWRAWSDCHGELERRFTNDQLLTTVMLYWVTGTIGSSFRFHRDWALGAASLPDALAEALADRAEVPPGVVRPLGRGERIQVPAAVALFDYVCPREWVERAYADLRRFTDMPRGGHFSAMEEPELLAEDLRVFFRTLR